MNYGLNLTHSRLARRDPVRDPIVRQVQRPHQLRGCRQGGRGGNLGVVVLKLLGPSEARWWCHMGEGESIHLGGPRSGCRSLGGVVTRGVCVEGGRLRLEWVDVQRCLETNSFLCWGQSKKRPHRTDLTWRIFEPPPSPWPEISASTPMLLDHRRPPSTS